MRKGKTGAFFTIFPVPKPFHGKQAGQSPFHYLCSSALFCIESSLRRTNLSPSERQEAVPDEDVAQAVHFLPDSLGQGLIAREGRSAGAVLFPGMQTPARSSVLKAWGGPDAGASLTRRQGGHGSAAVLTVFTGEFREGSHIFPVWRHSE